MHGAKVWDDTDISGSVGPGHITNALATNTQWLVGLSGNWEDAFNWSAGVPTSSANVTIDAVGTYTVTLSTAGAASFLTLDAAGATFAEAASASLSGTGATFDAGTAILDGVNTFPNPVTISGATVEIGNAAALGTGTIDFTAGEILALKSETLDNQIVFGLDETVAAAHNQILTIEPNWSFAPFSSIVQIGDANNDGTVIWETPSNTSSVPSELDVNGGTLKAGDGNFSLFTEQIANVVVAAGAKLDLAGVDTTIRELLGNGIVTSSSGSPTLSLGGAGFFGTIVGSISLDIKHVAQLLGTNTYSGGTTIESGAQLIIGGGGTTGSVAGAILDSGALDYERSGMVTIRNVISGPGAVGYLGQATYRISSAEAYTGQTLIRSEVQIGNAQSLGTGSWQLFNGELVATRDITMAVPGSVTAASSLAAAHDKVLTLDNLSFDSTSAVTIGDVGNDGAVVVEGGFAGPVSVDVRFGALRAGDGSALTDMLGSADTSTTVEAGAMIAWAGFGGTIGNLFGAGTVTNADGATITLLAGDFAGVIAGNSVLQIDGGVILSGASTYTGGTFVDSGGALALGNGGTTGSVVGSIVDNGVLIIDHSNAFAETAAISGAGSLIQRGAGTTTIDRAESYSGGTTVAAGELSIDRAAAIGSGPLDLAGGELLVTKSAALTNSLSVAGDATIAAATGSALSLSFSDWSFDAHSITFGDDNNAGTIVWHTPAGGDGVASGDQFTVDIHAGTLKAGDANLSELLFPAQNTTIDAGATLNVGAVGTAIGNLLGSGKLVGSGGTTLQIRNGDFAGQINGDIATVEVAGALRVSGSNTFTGQYELAGGSSLTLAHAATQDVAFFGDATLVFTLGNAYGGTVSNFDLKVGQTMDFAGLAFAQASEHFHNGVLTMTDGTHTERVHLAGTFSDASFALSDDHHGGTDVNFTGTTDSAYFGLG